uniref:AMP-dependent synthetase/ligase domain-containing protein n=1 Tax=Oryza barthii TaxID=65489 RepID=A0A0D3EZW2_9ORYZ
MAAMEGAVLCAANHAPLTPITFLDRAALVYPDRPAIVASSSGLTRTWRETRDRCLRLAAALAALGVHRHHVVAVFAQNIPAMCELHFGIPMAGAVICTLNSRLDAAMASVLLRHSEAKLIFVDCALLDVAHDAIRRISQSGATPPVLVLISELLDDPSDAKLPSGRVDYEYEHLVGNAGSSPEFAVRWDAVEAEGRHLQPPRRPTRRWRRRRSVGRPDEYWGETPCAFVKLRPGAAAAAKAGVVEEELMAYCRARLPRYMAPRTVVVVEEGLPKTATGKVQKFELRARAKAMGTVPAAKSKRSNL